MEAIGADASSLLCFGVMRSAPESGQASRILACDT
jgi:hypothetical protein